jgi:hypothetical protein
MELTIFDPDLDPEGHHARQVVGCIVTALGRA